MHRISFIIAAFLIFNISAAYGGQYVQNGDTAPLALSDLQRLYPLTSFPVDVGPDDDWLSENGYSRYVPPPPAQPAPPTLDEVKSQLTTTLYAEMDRVAQTKGFGDRHSLLERAAYAGRWQGAALAYATWIDACEVYGAGLAADCLAGVRLPPTAAELVAGMPTMIWPDGTPGVI